MKKRGVLAFRYMLHWYREAQRRCALTIHMPRYPPRYSSILKIDPALRPSTSGK